ALVWWRSLKDRCPAAVKFDCVGCLSRLPFFEVLHPKDCWILLELLMVARDLRFWFRLDDFDSLGWFRGSGLGLMILIRLDSSGRQNSCRSCRIMLVSVVCLDVLLVSS
ncbi:hypothetical protein Droror1_Dr00014664, partial [Drosera rotundifolia]